jgi:dTDP-4-dehydrorhamnose 3,5-epimerase-like enzyme
MTDIKFIQGNLHKDKRGKIQFFNTLDFNTIKRFYTIENANTQVFRAWQGHREEGKYFFVVEGSFTISVVKIDNWNAPSLDLIPDTFELNSNDTKILFVPGGCANGIKAKELNSKLIIFSTFSIGDAYGDSVRFNAGLWT